MEDNDLHKLKRSELLEILLAQSEEIDRLREEVARKDEQLAARRIAISQAGSIAEASLALTNIFEEAQKAADLYLENVKAQAADDPRAMMRNMYERYERHEAQRSRGRHAQREEREAGARR